MKILRATKRTQGTRKNDHFWTTEGELVSFAFECDGERIDGPCGCRRAMSGLYTHKSTTTIEVFDDPKMTLQELSDEMAASLVRAGWFKDAQDPECVAMAVANAADIAKVANAFLDGDVLEKRGDTFAVRPLATAEQKSAHRGVRTK